MVFNRVMILNVLCLMATNLHLNSEMSVAAQQSAENLAATGSVQTTYLQGENTVIKCSPQIHTPDASDATGDWYDESNLYKSLYDNITEFPNPDTAEFSHVVWKSSVEIGVGAAIAKVGDLYCTYFTAVYPVGNIEGNYSQNVLMPEVLLNRTALFDLLYSVMDNEPEQEQNTEPENLQIGQDCLVAHNKLRDVHNVPRMELNSAMNSKAQEYAVKLAAQGMMEHAASNDRDGDGENLAYFCSNANTNSTTAAVYAVSAWYNEVFVSGYDYNNNEFSSETGHFTQVVWKGSVELGCGTAHGTKDGMDCYYSVARYKIAGNMDGQFQQNVLKPENPLENKGEMYELLGVSDPLESVNTL